MIKITFNVYLILLLVITLVIAIISDMTLMVYLMCLGLIIGTILLWKQIALGKELDTLRKSLVYYRSTGKTKKILNKQQTEINQIIKDLNSLYDAYENIEVEKRVQIEQSKQLISNLSHDIRTPLTSIIGYVDALNDGVITDEEELLEFFEILSMKSKNLKHLIDQIFNVARIDADDVIMNYEYIELNQVVKQVLIDFIPQFEKLQIQLINEIKEEPFMVYADVVGITRVFQNILRNAIQHGKDGKIIGVRTRIDGSYYRVVIWDRGKGIPKAKQKHIFERLFKVDDSRKFGSSNSGLGMSIAKKIIERHNGRIALESKEGKLTEFFVELPMLEELNI